MQARGPDHSAFTQQPYGAGQPVPPVPPAGGIAKSLRYLRGLVPGTVFLLLAAAVAEYALPYDHKPSTVLGRFSGAHDTAELRAKQEAQAEYNGAIAEASAAVQRMSEAYNALWQRGQMLAQAATQMETVILQHQQQAVTNGQGAMAFGANIADLACLLGRLPSDDRHTQRTLQSACGAGAEMRRGMANELAAIGRNGSSIIPRDIFRDLPDPMTMIQQSFQPAWERALQSRSTQPGYPQTSTAREPARLVQQPRVMTEEEARKQFRDTLNLQDVQRR